jgi:TPR repeat protein
MSAKGEGVPQNHAEAVKWFQLAADRGNPEAQYNLGLAYATGMGVSQDNVSAHMWLNLAATGFASSDAAKRSLAAHARDAVADKMSPAQVAEAQRLASAWNAAADVRVAANDALPR